jgi:hypothetical protein
LVARRISAEDSARYSALATWKIAPRAFVLFKAASEAKIPE